MGPSPGESKIRCLVFPAPLRVDAGGAGAGVGGRGWHATGVHGHASQLDWALIMSCDSEDDVTLLLRNFFWILPAYHGPS